MKKNNKSHLKKHHPDPINSIYFSHVISGINLKNPGIKEIKINFGPKPLSPQNKTIETDLPTVFK